MGPSAVRGRRRRQRPARPRCRVSEVDPHHDTAQCRTADLGETGIVNTPSVPTWSSSNITFLVVTGYVLRPSTIASATRNYSSETVLLSGSSRSHSSGDGASKAPLTVMAVVVTKRRIRGPPRGLSASVAVGSRHRCDNMRP